MASCMYSIEIVCGSCGVAVNGMSLYHCWMTSRQLAMLQYRVGLCLQMLTCVYRRWLVSTDVGLCLQMLACV